ncbi:MAG: hypothetical protein NTZ35_13450 [Ignavibacteriales bacterium]|nr:hypothetical protein [Ignavibacteriales bacterium]
MTRRLSSIVIVAALFFGISFAQNSVPYTRDEVATLKKKLVNALDAVGQPPAGYAKERENFSLPTDASKNHESGLFYPAYGSGSRTFGADKSAEKSQKDLQKDYEKKVAEAQAKGDYQAITKLAQEMQQKAGQMQLKSIEGKKVPIEIHININSNSGEAIDPDGVLFERTGVIALKEKSDGDEEKSRVRIFFDPINLKDTKQLSKVDMKMPEKGVKSKTSVYNITIEFNGPTSEIEAWAKKIESGKVLAQIDGK